MLIHQISASKLAIVRWQAFAPLVYSNSQISKILQVDFSALQPTYVEITEWLNLYNPNVSFPGNFFSKQRYLGRQFILFAKVPFFLAESLLRFLCLPLAAPAFLTPSAPFSFGGIRPCRPCKL